jgi:predicted nuclease of restriction endonuclease-like (RecB) superfamily
MWQRAVAKLTWAHNVILIQKVKDLPTRLWYARQAFQHGWSRDVLSLRIQSRAHERHGNAVTNFPRTLPPPQSDLASQLLKDPYVFDFLTLEKTFHERELETGLLRHLQDFLVELVRRLAASRLTKPMIALRLNDLISTLVSISGANS